MEMQRFELADILTKQAELGTAYYEFLKPDTLSMSIGIYQLLAGAEDQQNPHSEDEVYYVVSGRSQMMVGAEHFAVQAGSIIYVKAEVEHRFYDIAEDLVILVAFSPAEYSEKNEEG